MDQGMREERSLAETPTWSVATVTTVMVAVCFIVERSICRFGKWLKKTKRKALLASLDKIKEELMLLGFISLMLGQWARWISEICVKSSLFGSRFYPCARDDVERLSFVTVINQTVMPLERISVSYNHCAEGHEPFVSYESLEQLHRFLFLLGVTHVLYSCFTIVLAMIKIYSWRAWETQANTVTSESLHGKRNVVIKRQSTFVFHHTSHPWSKNKILIWMLCFFRQFKDSIKRSDYMALRLGFITNHRLPLSYDFHKYMVRSMEDEFHGIVGISWPLWIYAILCIFINVHGLNVYFWLSFVPLLLILLVGTKLQHVVAQLALEVVETTGPLTGTQLKPRDELFWFGKPELLLWLIQFISFQNAFEMATFLWSVWDIKTQSCFMKNHVAIVIRLVSGVVAQFWCSYITLPLNVIISQMGSKFKKALVSESVRESLHGWCKRVKEKSKHKYSSHLPATRSTCSLTSTIDEGDDETITVLSGTLSRCATTTTMRSLSLNHVGDDETITVLSGTLSRCPSTSSRRSLSLNHISVNCEENYADDVIHEEEYGTQFQTSGYFSDSSDNASIAALHESDIDNERIDDHSNYYNNGGQQ